MKRIFQVLTLAALLAAFAMAFADQHDFRGPPGPPNGDNHCVNCNNAQAELKQRIDITVPTVVSLILDERVSQSANAGETSWLDGWRIDLSGRPNYEGANCYVVPNWVGYDGPGGVSLMQFIGFVGGIDHLFPAWNSAVHGTYPAIISENDHTLTWGQVAAKWPQFARYAFGHPTDPAKGNIVCYNSFAVEKYTNCEGVQLTVMVQSLRPDDSFGTLYVKDQAKVSGVPGPGRSTAWVPFSEASGARNQQLLLSNIPRGTFIDDLITQLMWLRDAQAGEHHLVTTYTLGSALVRPN